MVGFFANHDLRPNRIELARQRVAQKEYIDLTSSNPTHQGLLFPPAILQEAAAPYWSNRQHTPDPRGLPMARAAIAQYYAQRTPPLMLDCDDIFITASTSEAYSLLFALLTEPGDNILAPDVSYPLFEYLAAMHHIELRSYTLDEQHGWQIDPSSLTTSVNERTRAILIISPHNPTGAIVHTPVETLSTTGLPVICDEVFAAFTYQRAHTPPLGTLHPDIPIFHLNGISKMFALPDLKLGWMGLNREAATQYSARLELLNDTLLGANALTQHMLPTVFTEGMGFVDLMVQRVQANLDRALQILTQNEHVHIHPPDGGYYLFPKITNWYDEEALVLHLLNHGVYVHPGYFYGYDQHVHIAISCLVAPEQLTEGLQRLITTL
ncbi:MAG: pyridoxal phosphate-dependent aminotransferase [Chloroflexi bacterium AL-W]|nr:pyridoxal phosphate-dependent aminotransferase [Chloroflexi bacterium AL-W]